MQALVINMKESQNRWDFMVEQLKFLGINYSRLEAFDLARLNQKLLDRYQQSWERPLRKAEVGCFLSHMSAWRKVAKENKPYLILEDDVILRNDTGKILSNFNQTYDYGLINLETTQRLKLIGNSKVRLDYKYSLRRLFHNKTGAAAYIIWPSLANKLLSKYSNHKAALADAALYTNFFKFKQFQLTPAVAIQMQHADAFNLTPPFEIKSTISVDEINKKFGLKFLKRRIKTQLSVFILQVILLFRAKYTRVELEKAD